ncbi:PilN domain-containing protein [Candidatus Gottesmanbacteria bacterium]|nr:PilN domain-containing protein [Candidatus Gottesmanbacteria bacterium]
MPAKQIKINLLGSQDLEHTPWGRLISWATTYGRYIMITTEIVVLLAFISRFSLDRKNTDLTEELSQKQAILQANIGFEKEIKSLQANLATTKQLMAEQGRAVTIINTMETMLPPDVYLTSFEITKNKINIAATAGTTGGFAQFLSNIQSTKLIRNVVLGDIQREPGSGINFQLSADTGEPTPAKK